MNLLNTSVLLIFGISNIVSVSASASAAAAGDSEVVKRLKQKMPIYTAVYDMNGDETQVDVETSLGGHGIAERPSGVLDFRYFDPKKENGVSVNAFPHKRSALHRAIEAMNVEAVRWLLNRENVNIFYGFKENEDGNFYLLDKKERANYPPHLVGHLEEYYRDSAKGEAQEIMKLLNDAGLSVADWPAKNEQFIEARADLIGHGITGEPQFDETSSYNGSGRSSPTFGDSSSDSGTV